MPTIFVGIDNRNNRTLFDQVVKTFLSLHYDATKFRKC